MINNFSIENSSLPSFPGGTNSYKSDVNNKNKETKLIIIVKYRFKWLTEALFYILYS